MPELGFQYELTRSDRRTLSIKISRDAKVLVYAPRRMSLKHIEDFLFEKREWVLKNLAKVQERKDISDSFVPREASEMFQCIKYEDKREVFGLKIHSFSTLDRIKKYDNSDNGKSAEKPYSIEVGEIERTINLYAIASTKFQVAV